MAKQDLLTVIIPVRNGEPFIRKCLDSVVNQSLADVRLIVVDDGSTDNTVQIVQNYTSQYYNLTLIRHMKNKGTGEARNTGFLHSESKFVAFLDADDWVDTNCYYLMVDSLEKTNAEIAICGVKNEYGSPHLSSIRYSYPFANLISSEFALHLLARSYTQDAYITPMVGNKVFRRDLLVNNQLLFPSRSLFEDDEFMFLAIWLAKKIILVPDCFQHYYQRSGSAMHSFSYSSVDCLIQSFQGIKRFFDERNQFSLVEDDYYAFFDRCISSLLGTLFSCFQNATEQRKYLTYIMEQALQLFPIRDFINHTDPIRFQYFWSRL